VARISAPINRQERLQRDGCQAEPNDDISG
jgi:hypothetical protein